MADRIVTRDGVPIEDMPLRSVYVRLDSCTLARREPYEAEVLPRGHFTDLTAGDGEAVRMFCDRVADAFSMIWPGRPEVLPRFRDLRS